MLLHITLRLPAALPVGWSNTLAEGWQLHLKTGEIGVKGMHRLERSLLSIRELLVDV